MPRHSLTIYVFLHTRAEFVDAFLRTMLALDKVYRGEIRVSLLSDRASFMLGSGYARRMRQAGYSATNRYHKNYSDKVTTVSRCKTPYVMKIDEDVYLTPESLEALLLVLLSGKLDENCALVPTLSTGIPTVEYFLDEFTPNEVQHYIRKIFASVEFGTHWGVDYSCLNGFYNYQQKDLHFVRYVNQVIASHYRGIHPVRISENAQVQIASWVKQDSAWKIPKHHEVLRLENIYFCNSVMICTSKTYREMVFGLRTGRYVDDGFDEVGINMHLSRNNGHLAVATGIAAIHPSYNTISQYCEVSKDFFKSL